MVAGFITRAHVLLAAGQLDPLLGVCATGQTVPALVASLAAQGQHIDRPTVTSGAGMVAVLA